ncbi:MAG: GNAT family N-acetyltransferase [Myxococcota bacterium]
MSDAPADRGAAPETAPEAIETERLRGERATPAHLPEFLRVAEDALAAATLGGRAPRPVLEERFARWLREWDEAGFGLWIWRERASGAHVGHAALRRDSRFGPRDVELGYALHPDAWARGFATEAARALVAVAFERLALPELVAFTLPTNAGSRRVMEAAGFHYERDIEHAGRTHVLYRRSRGG